MRCEFIIDVLDALPIHVMQRALDWFRFQHFLLIPPSQAGPERVSVSDSHLVIAQLDLDDEALDHDPGRLDVLPAERVGHLLLPGMEYFLERLRGELKMPGMQLTFHVSEFGGMRCFFGFPLP